MIAGQIDDRRFDADLAGSTVKNQIDFIAQIVTYVFCGGRADAAEFVGGWSGDPATELTQQLKGDRVIGHAQADRVLAAGQVIAHTKGALQHQGQRSRPEARRELPRVIGNLARPALQLPRVADMNDDRVAGRTALYLVDARDCGGVGGVGAEPVYRFSGKRDKTTAPEHRRGFANNG